MSSYMWVSAKQTEIIQGVTIGGGGYFVGTGMQSADSKGPEVALVRRDVRAVPDMVLPKGVSIRAEEGYSGMHYAFKGAYLRWLSSTRMEAPPVRGMLELYWYGLERRAYDLLTSPVTTEPDLRALLVYVQGIQHCGPSASLLQAQQALQKLLEQVSLVLHPGAKDLILTKVEIGFLLLRGLRGGYLPPSVGLLALQTWARLTETLSASQNRIDWTATAIALNRTNFTVSRNRVSSDYTVALPLLSPSFGSRGAVLHFPDLNTFIESEEGLLLRDCLVYEQEDDDGSAPLLNAPDVALPIEESPLDTLFGRDEAQTDPPPSEITTVPGSKEPKEVQPVAGGGAVDHGHVLKAEDTAATEGGNATTNFEADVTEERSVLLAAPPPIAEPFPEPIPTAATAMPAWPAAPTLPLPASLSAVGLEGGAAMLLRIITTRKYWARNDLVSLAAYLQVDFRKFEAHLDTFAQLECAPLVKDDVLWLIPNKLRKEVND